MESSKQVTIAALSPAGTYSEQAAHKLAKKTYTSEQYKLSLHPSIRSVIESLVTNECNLAVVPVENSINGRVISTSDTLWQNMAVQLLLQFY